MNLFGLTITRTKRLPSSLMPVDYSSQGRAWWPLLQEFTTGGWQRNEEIRVDTVLSNPTLYACITLIAADIAKLRPMLVEQDENRIWTETDSPAFSPVLRQPNAYQTRIDFYEWWMISKLVHGNTYVLKRRDNRGVVNALYILDPYRVTPLIAPDGSVFYQLDPKPLAEIQDPIIVPASEIIHDVMCPLFHELCGVSPIYAAGFPALQGLNIRNASDKFFRNGSRPGGILLVPGQMTQAQADEMKTAWKAAFSGNNQGDVAVLTGGMTYQAMAMTAEQSRLVDQLRMTDEDIAKCFHMPRYKVGIGPDPTYNNVNALNNEYLAECLQKHILSLQIHLTYGLEMDNVPNRTLAVEFDLDDLLLMDIAAKADAAQKAVNAGLSYNEARFRFWDAPPVSGGESPMAQQQNFSLEALARRDAEGPAPAVPGTGSAAPANDPTVSDGRVDDPSVKHFELLQLVGKKVSELRAA